MRTASKSAGRARPSRAGAKASVAAPVVDPPTNGAGLSEAEIVRAAREIIAEAGVGGLTMRRLSNALGVALGATYHHVATKHDLLVLVGRDLYSEMSLPPHGGTWETRLKKVMMSQVAIVGRYPGMANFMMTHVDELVPTELNQMVRGILLEAGFSERGMAAVLSALFFYVTGMLAGGFAAPKVKAYQGRDMFAAFEDGLDVLIAGARARLEENRKSKRTSLPR